MPIARPFEPRSFEGSGWRVVEAQHKNATMALTAGNLSDQQILEDIVETAKPTLPPAAAGLHFLLASPFRYRPRFPRGSRFRGRDDPGVFYGAEDERTACAEAGYWRLQFWLDSAGLRERPTSMPMTLFRFHGATPRCLDLTTPPLVEQRIVWVDPSDYNPTQDLARAARKEGIELIRYESVRNAPEGRCLAILAPEFFRRVEEPFRYEQQGWSLFLLPPERIVWQRNLDGISFEVCQANGP